MFENNVRNFSILEILETKNTGVPYIARAGILLYYFWHSTDYNLQISIVTQRTHNKIACPNCLFTSVSHKKFPQ